MTGLILIDCWAPDPLSSQASKDNKKNARKRNDFFVNLVDNLKRFKFTAVVNSSTHNIQISEHVENYLSTCPNVFNLLTQRDFFKLKKHKPWKNISHWVVVGTTWQVCAHLNDLGLCSFFTMSQQHSDLNFYGVPWGFLKHDLTVTTDEDFATDLLAWHYSPVLSFNAEGMYKLINNNQDIWAIRNKYIDATPY